MPSTHSDNAKSKDYVLISERQMAKQGGTNRVYRNDPVKIGITAKQHDGTVVGRPDIVAG